MPNIDIETAGKIIGSLNNSAFECPHCGQDYDAGESETAQYVVSYWGEEDHDFTCDHCGGDFIVRETVMRSFASAKSRDELE